MTDRAQACPQTSQPEESALTRVFYSLRWPVTVLCVLFALRYIVWRGMYTLDHQTPLRLGVSLLLYAAELFGFVSILLLFIQTRKLTRREAAPMPEDKIPTVDILVTIYNEPLEVLNRTLTACVAMDYPADRFKVYVCDDGRREEVKALAGALGCGYITRPDNRHAKAGNTNNALKYISGELFLILDCDHIPVRSFLKETVGFFSAEEKLAFVQTPHHFYNPDCHQKNLSVNNEVVHEQDLFFQVIQPGKDNDNAAIFAGSACVFRRSAVDAIGGFRHEVAIEDLHTGMELHSRGYKSFFYNRILVGGLSAETYTGYLTQRNRWTKGGIQLFMLDNPLFKSGLTVMQKLSYLSSIQYFFGALPRLIFLLAPLPFLLFSFAPLVASVSDMAWYFLPYYLLSHYAFQMLAKEYRSPFWSDVYDAGTSFLLSFTVVTTLLRPEKLIFKVTPKGEGTKVKGEVFHWRYVLPHIILMLLIIAGLVKGAYAVSAQRLPMDAFMLGGIWAVFNLLLLAASIEVARERPQTRSSYRVNRRVPCKVFFSGLAADGETVDLSEEGALVQLNSHHDVPSSVSVQFRGQVPDDSEYECAVIRTVWIKEKGDRLALRFSKLTEAARRGVILQMFSAPDTWNFVRRPVTDSFTAMTHIAATAVRRKKQAVNPVVKIARHKTNIPCSMLVDGRTIDCVIENLSLTGAALRVASGEALTGSVTMQLKTAEGQDLSVVASPVKKIFDDGKFARYGMNFVSPAQVEPGVLIGAQPAKPN
jgi:cellulose synthase (UDP-forming)